MVTVRLTAAERGSVLSHAQAASIGGVSRVRMHATRAAMLQADQVVGQLGEAALSKYLTGSVDLWLATRAVRNAAPTTGDQGGDLLGWNVDVKTSVMRRSKDPNSYRLLVRPAERTKGTVYILALVDSPESTAVILVGWLAEHDLPDRVHRGGIFEGTYAVPATLLHPLPPFQVVPNE